MRKSNKPSLTQQAMQALVDAVAKVVEDHRRRDKPLAVWRDGKAVWIPATEASALPKSAWEINRKYRGLNDGHQRQD